MPKPFAFADHVEVGELSCRIRIGRRDAHYNSVKLLLGIAGAHVSAFIGEDLRAVGPHPLAN